MADVQRVPLHEATRERYLSYALSVITARALPDVRDGLKPVQRRILYTMFHELNLYPDRRYRKSAAVVGEVMGKYHPHGDTAIYDAMVRMAQDFSLRLPLVDGQGNFGSLDGDPPAAMRYTECKLLPLAMELLTELRKEVVAMRATYDGQNLEPVVLPSQFPNLLVNGSEGIAVGMATRIPPHHLGEVCEAAASLIEDRTLTVEALCQIVKAPDFPTGGHITSSPQEIREAYETGQGSLRVQSTWTLEKEGRSQLLVLTSVPYGQNKARIIEQLGADIAGKKVPQIVDVRDESKDDVRIVCELKHGASPEAAVAWLFKHTKLESSWPMNLTCLVPQGEVSAPARCDLKEMLTHWLDFRFETVRRRFEYDLRKLEERIHILRAFVAIFNALDEAIAIIRSSAGRRQAAERLMDRFDLDDIQADAILDLQLYRLTSMAIDAIREELEEKMAEAERIRALLASDQELWNTVKKELAELARLYESPRRTTLGTAESLEYDETKYIVSEDAYVVVSREGWFKRQTSFTEVEKIRVRDGDEVGWLIRANTRTTVTVFTSAGSAYTVLVADVPATSGYGDPLSALFSFEDGEHVVGVISHDPRHLPEALDQPSLFGDDTPMPPYVVSMTLQGRIARLPLEAFKEPSTRSGRKYQRLGKGRDGVLAAWMCPDGTSWASVATRGGRAMLFATEEAPVLKGSGKGVIGIKLRDDDELLAFELVKEGRSLDGCTVITGQGRELVVRTRKFELSSRGGRGNVVLRRGTIDTWVRRPQLAFGDENEEE